MSKHYVHTASKLVRSLSSHPSYLVLYVTNRCDLSCPFCFNRQERKKDITELSFEEIKTLAHSCGTLFELLISGGEPFLRSDLDRILLEFIRYSRPGVIAIPTHGGHTERIKTCLEKILPYAGNTRVHINLSIDDIGSAHDEIRGKPGLSEDILKTGQVLRDLKRQYTNLWFGVITVFGQHNKDSFEDLVAWVHKKIKPDIHDIGLERDVVISQSPEVVKQQYERIQNATQNIVNTSSGIESVLYKTTMQYLMESIDKGYPVDGCSGGRRLITVTADGRVYPCEPFWLEPDKFSAFKNTLLGRLQDHDGRLDRLLKTNHAQQIIAKIKSGQCKCFWECALFCNILFTFKGWLRLSRTTISRS